MMSTIATCDEKKCKRSLLSKVSHFRYIVHGIPKQKKYTMEEAKWSEESQTFTNEHIYTINWMEVKLWLGYLPSHIGLVQNVVWYSFPDICSVSSPFQLWLTNKHVFFPHSLEKLRDSTMNQKLNVPGVQKSDLQNHVREHKERDLYDDKKCEKHEYGNNENDENNE
jgi:hypothetical protein